MWRTAMRALLGILVALVTRQSSQCAELPILQTLDQQAISIGDVPLRDDGKTLEFQESTMLEFYPNFSTTASMFLVPGCMSKHPLWSRMEAFAELLSRKYHSLEEINRSTCRFCEGIAELTRRKEPLACSKYNVIEEIDEEQGGILTLLKSVFGFIDDRQKMTNSLDPYPSIDEILQSFKQLERSFVCMINEKLSPSSMYGRSLWMIVRHFPLELFQSPAFIGEIVLPMLLLNEQKLTTALEKQLNQFFLSFFDAALLKELEDLLCVPSQYVVAFLPKLIAICENRGCSIVGNDVTSFFEKDDKMIDIIESIYHMQYKVVQSLGKGGYGLLLKISLPEYGLFTVKLPRQVEIYRLAKYRVHRKNGRAPIRIWDDRRNQLTEHQFWHPDLTTKYESRFFQYDYSIFHEYMISVKLGYHPNILQVLGFINHVPLVFKGGVGLAACPLLIYEFKEYCLSSYLDENPSLTRDERISILYDLIKGLDYMHSKLIVHWDIKMENMFFHKGRAIIGDLGLAVDVGCGYRRHRRGGHIFMPPTQSDPFSRDIWSLGLLAVELFLNINLAVEIPRSMPHMMYYQKFILTDKLQQKFGLGVWAFSPYLAKQKRPATGTGRYISLSLANVKYYAGSFHAQLTSQYDAELANFVTSMLTWNESKRPDTGLLLNHPIFSPLRNSNNSFK